MKNSSKTYALKSKRQKQRILFYKRHNDIDIEENDCIKKKSNNTENSYFPSTQSLDSAISYTNKIQSDCYNGNKNDGAIVFNESKDDDALSNDFLSEDDGSDDENVFEDDYIERDNIMNFCNKLSTAFTVTKMNHDQCNTILKVLQSHECFSQINGDVRAYLKTPRKSFETISVKPGEYIHLGTEETLHYILSTANESIIPNKLIMDFHTDGACIHKSSSKSVWPIQIRIVNLPCTKPEMIGIYYGKGKPEDPEEFFKKFVSDVNILLDEGGIQYKSKKIPLQLRCFVADAPARSLILNHKGHMAAEPCSKCIVSGSTIQNRMVFLAINNEARTNEDYRKAEDNHHKVGKKNGLIDLPINMVQQVPFEAMHLLYLGVMKKILSAMIEGKYDKGVKLSYQQINQMSRRMEILSSYCPSDFARKPRSFSEYKLFKATELRQLLLHTGPVIFDGIVSRNVYSHFLMLHTSVRILTFYPANENLMLAAKLMLETFVKRCPDIYGKSFVSYNVHGVLHLVDDVRNFGSLNDYSAFPYENSMRVFKYFLRKPNQPLQQIAHRITETRNALINSKTYPTNYPEVADEHRNGPETQAIINYQQYKKIKMHSMSFDLTKKNSACILANSDVGIIKNILKMQNEIYLLVQKFDFVESLFDVGISSNKVSIFKCANLSQELYIVNSNEISSKCYLMPLWDSSENCNIQHTEQHRNDLQKWMVSVLHTTSE